MTKQATQQAVASYRTQGYQGSNDYNYQDALEWAMTSPAGLDAYCTAVHLAWRDCERLLDQAFPEPSLGEQLVTGLKLGLGIGALFFGSALVAAGATECLLSVVCAEVVGGTLDATAPEGAAFIAGAATATTATAKGLDIARESDGLVSGKQAHVRAVQTEDD